MRAVNLLPSDLRGAAPKAARPARPEKAEGIGAFVLIGALALSVAALAGYVLITNDVKQRQADLVTAQQSASAAQAKAAALKPYADFEALANARVETVRGLAAARFDWEQALGDLSRAVPTNVKLASLNGDMGLPGSTGGGGDPLRGSIAAPAITLTGCAPSQRGVARMMSRVKAVDGVTRVTLSKSIKPAETTADSSAVEAPCGAKSPPSFSVVVFFERSDVLANLTTGSDASMLVPTVLSGPTTAPGATDQPTDPTAAGAAAPAPAPATDAAPATDPPAGATKSNSTPTGSTP